jgi:hypothetical protein
MVLKNVERDPEYRDLLFECLREVETRPHPTIHDVGVREAFIFLSSPGSVTPYHMDPECNFLLQVRGLKTMHVFDQDDRSQLSEEELERFFAGAHRNMVFKDAYQAKAKTFNLLPGQGVHVPPTAPHWVQNGPDVSISFSITFQTRLTERRAAVYRFNHWLRRRGWTPRSYGLSPWRDRVKYNCYRILRRIGLGGRFEGGY